MTHQLFFEPFEFATRDDANLELLRQLVQEARHPFRDRQPAFSERVVQIKGDDTPLHCLAGVGLCQRPSTAMSASASSGPQLPGV